MGELIDLDLYRDQRVVDGTWPPDEKTVIEYWKSRIGKGEKIKPPAPEPKKTK
jgi:hypothetical protein